MPSQDEPNAGGHTGPVPGAFTPGGRMEVGIVVPQGWTGEYGGWDASSAWRRTLEIARRSERLGAGSLWVYDHFHTTPDPSEEITFESFVTLAGLASVTERVRLGHLVLCAGFRNPALVAKMLSTLDVATGGRMESGIGAGWKEEEWLAYGYRFPPLSERLGALRDALEIVTRMLGADRSSYEGAQARIEEAINVPQPLQRPMPIIVGGNGPDVTWRLAARYADEVNLDAVAPGRLAEARGTIAARCEEIGRDPASLRISVHLWLKDRAWLEPTGEEHLPMTELLGRYRELGVSRVMALVPGCVVDDEVLERFFEEAREAGAGPAPSRDVVGSSAG